MFNACIDYYRALFLCVLSENGKLCLFPHIVADNAVVYETIETLKIAPHM